MTDMVARTAPRLSSTRAVVLTSATSVGMMVMGFATGVISARFLGADARGELAAAQTIGTLVGTYATLSLGESLIFFVRTRARAAPVVLKSAAGLALIPVVIAAVVAIFLMPLFLGGDSGAIPATRWYCLIGVTLVLLGYPVTYRLATGDAVGWNALRWIVPVCWLLTLLGFVVADTRSVTGIVATFVVVQLVVAPLLWRRPFRRRGSWRAAPVDASLFRPMLRYGAPLLLATAPATLNVRVDQLVIANREPAAELGRYAVSVSFATAGVVVLSSVGTILFPHLAALAIRDQVDALTRAVRGTAIVALVVGALTAVAAPAAVPVIFGDEYAVPAVVPIALAAGTALLGLNTVLEAGLRGLNAPRWILLAEVIGIVTTVVLVAALLPPLGLGGAALASTSGPVAVMVTVAVFLRRRFGVRPTDLLVPRRSDLRALLGRLGQLRQA